MINRGSTGRFVPSTVYIGFPLFVLAKRRSEQLLTLRWKARGAVGFQGDRNVGTLFCPASPRPAVRPAPLTRPARCVSGFWTRQVLSCANINCSGYSALRLIFDASFINLLPDIPCMKRVYKYKNCWPIGQQQSTKRASSPADLSSPIPKHTSDRSGWGARPGGGAGSSKT